MRSRRPVNGQQNGLNHRAQPKPHIIARHMHHPIPHAPKVPVPPRILAAHGIGNVVPADDVGRESGGWFHYVNDPIGTPERLVDEAGAIAAEYQRRAWGELTAKAGAKATTPIRLQGQYADDETGLAYNRYRYFDQANRSFTSYDPIGLGGGLNAFAQCANPTRYTDPVGFSATVLKNGTLYLVNKYDPGTAESKELTEYTKKWNKEIKKKGSMQRRCQSKEELRESKKWKKEERETNPELYQGKVVGHVRDAGIGGVSAGGTAMPLDAGVNSYLGGIIGGVPKGEPYKKVVLVKSLDEVPT